MTHRWFERALRALVIHPSAGEQEIAAHRADFERTCIIPGADPSEPWMMRDSYDRENAQFLTQHADDAIAFVTFALRPRWVLGFNDPFENECGLRASGCCSKLVAD